MRSNLKVFSVTLTLAAVVFISVAATKPGALKIEKVNNVNDTGYFKNLQVLPKNISKDSLDNIMHSYTKALGVHCNFCHAFANGKPDFASDEKEEKGIARYMMHMTTSIDSAYFNFEKSTRPDTISVIKCITCHHGNPHPDEASVSVGNGDHDHNMPPPGSPSNGQIAPPQPDSSKHNK